MKVAAKSSSNSVLPLIVQLVNLSLLLASRVAVVQMSVTTLLDRLGNGFIFTNISIDL